MLTDCINTKIICLMKTILLFLILFLSSCSHFHTSFQGSVGWGDIPTEVKQSNETKAKGVEV